MSYSINLCDPVTGKILETEEKHHIKGSTYALGGDTNMSLDITYNYSKHFYEHIDKEKGIRAIYGLTGAESLPLLNKAIQKLKDDKTDNYWQDTEGNAKAALCGLKAFAIMRPDGIWEGD